MLLTYAVNSSDESDLTPAYYRDPSLPLASELQVGEDLISDLQSCGSDETPEKIGKDDPDYSAAASDVDFPSEDEYADDSDAEAASDVGLPFNYYLPLDVQEFHNMHGVQFCMVPLGGR